MSTSLTIEPSSRSTTVQAGEILKRLRLLQQARKGDLKGIPAAGTAGETANDNRTDPDFPTDSTQPKDPGFQLPGTVTGSGSGKELS